MAVNLKSTYGYELVKLFGVNLALVGKAKDAGIVIDYSPKGALSIIGPNGENHGVLPLKTQAITLAKAGNLGALSKKAIVYQIEKSLNTALAGGAGVEFDEVQAAIEFMSSGQKAALTKKKKKEELKTLHSGNGPKSLKVSTTGQVHLSEATKLYQPVFGTSNGSVYYVVARMKGVNVALRHKQHGGGISIRMEGPGLSDYNDAFIGMKIDHKGKYASGHFSCEADLKAKTLGALIGAMGFHNVIEVGNISEVPYGH